MLTDEAFKPKESKKGKRNRRREEKVYFEEQLEKVRQLELEDAGKSVNLFEDKLTEEQKNILRNLQDMFCPLVDRQVVSLLYEENELSEERTLAALQDLSSQHELEQIQDKIDNEEIFGKEEELDTGDQQLQFLRKMFPSLQPEFLLSELVDNEEDLSKAVENLLELTFLAEENSESTDDSDQEANFNSPAPVVKKPSWGVFLSAWKRPEDISYISRSNHSSPQIPSSHPNHNNNIINNINNSDSSDYGNNNLVNEEQAFESKIDSVAEILSTVPRHIIVWKLEYMGDNVQQTIDYLLEYQHTLESSSSLLHSRKSSIRDKNIGTANNTNSPIIIMDAAWSSTSLSDKLKFNILRKQFPWVEPEIVASVLQFNQNHLSRSITALNELYPQLVLKPSPSTSVHIEDDIEEDDNTINSHSNDINNNKQNKTNNNNNGIKKEKPFKLVQSKQRKPKKNSSDQGSSMSYKDQANYYASVRNTYYRQAASAFMSGNGVSASQLSKQGRHFDALMREAHQKACSEIFESLRPSNNMLNVDLHGLQVKQSLDVVEEVLIKAEQNENVMLVSIITGVGNHSEGHRARIRPAVRSYLKENAYRFNEPKEGVLVVKIR